MAPPIVYEVTSLRWADVKKVGAAAGAGVVAVMVEGGPIRIREQLGEAQVGPRPSALQLPYAPSAAEILRRNR
jgi:hypothetical protein